MSYPVSSPPRRAPLSSSESEGEIRELNKRFKTANAAKGRIEKARKERDKTRRALARAYQRALADVQERVHASVAKYHELNTAMHTNRLMRLKQAAETRDEKLKQIALKLFDLQRIMSNHGVQLCALYEGRSNDISGMLPEARKVQGVEDKQQSTHPQSASNSTFKGNNKPHPPAVSQGPLDCKEPEGMTAKLRKAFGVHNA